MRAVARQCIAAHTSCCHPPHPNRLGTHAACPPADFAAAPASGLQLLRMPLVQPEAGPGGLLPFHSRRRRVTGMAASAGGDLLVATKQVGSASFWGAS